jgi:hypothetical protein
MDRQVLGVLKGPLQQEFGWNDIDYGNLVFSFQVAYALGMIFVGRLIDNLFTLRSDLFPLRAVASVVGIGGIAGGRRRNVDRRNRGSRFAMDRQLHDPLFYRGLSLPDCIALIHPLSPKLIPARMG